MFMNDEFQFLTEEDKKVCFEYWDNEVELYVDKFGRIFTEANKYVADISFEN